MSSFGTKNHQHQHNHHQLRRQKTCFEVGSTNLTKLRDTSTVMTAGARRGFCLQRQLSVDATSVIVNPSKYVSGYEKNNSISNSTNDLTWKCGSNASLNTERGNTSEHHPISKTSTVAPPAVPIIKKRSTQPINTGKTTEQEITDRHKKALKDRGNRLNLNIFLSHSINSQDGDLIGSDAESSNESMTILNKENSTMVIPDEQPHYNKTDETNSNTNNISSSSSSSNNDSDNSNNNNQVPVKKILDSTVTSIKPRRPPLVRAMSAPIRPKHDDSALTMAGGNGSIQVKRKLKKKKIVMSRDNLFEEKFDENDNELDAISNSSDSTSNLFVSAVININATTTGISSGGDNSISNEIKKSTKLAKKTTLQRPRSAAVGNEVVTLVSLLSSGGSDSEKEDSHSTTQQPAASAVVPTKSDIIDFSTRHRAPLLRKSGKSVSFQERDLPPEIPSTTRDFSKYRRGSVAPIAARLRLNRPPTAPAGSIYLCDIDISSDDFMKAITSNQNSNNYNYNADNIACSSNRNKKQINGTKVDDVKEIEINYPENVRTPKEKECWKLYQKMLIRGVTVSYDTILRGMLTPTELRIIQKQNESKRIFDVEPSVGDGNGNSMPTDGVGDGNATSSFNNSISSNLNEIEND